MEPFNVLIADDHQLFREGMESLLRKLSFIHSVFHASNGNEALAVIEKHSVELVFMDIRMPELNGIEATKLLRQKRNEINIIAITMLEDVDSVVSMFRAGANGYLLKNTSFIEMQEAIKTVMSGERYYAKDISRQMLDSMFTGKKQVSKTFQKDSLTPREKEIVGLICRGFASKDIGEILNITTKTVENHRNHIYTKLNISNTADMVYYALQEGIVSG